MKTLLLAITFAISLQASAQLITVPDGGNKKAMVGERIGITDVTIHYDRPGVKGREGKIWGGLVPYGFTDLGFGTSKAAPWRAGANENTTIEFSTPVKVQGKDVPAGKYALFIAVGPEESTLILSTNSTSWGSFFYEPKEDALRVPIKQVTMKEPVEWLKYEFSDEKANSAVVNLMWEYWKFPFTIETDLVKEQLESFRNELRNSKGFRWNAWNQAARFTLANNTNLEEGLKWAETSISTPFVGEANFTTLSTKAQILSKLGRQKEADSIMKVALPMGSMNEVHNFARQMVGLKKAKEAFDIFKMNYDKNPNTFTTNVGMARGYSAVGDYKNALLFMQKAQPQAPDPGNKVAVERMIGMLKEGKDIN